MQDRNRARAEIANDRRPDDLNPKHLVKQEFGRRVYRLMLERGWSQSELSRQADLPRDAISVYVRGVSVPTPQSLLKLANALGVAPEELLPDNGEGAMEADPPSLELRVGAADPSKAWLRIERMVSTRTASKIVELLATDDAAIEPSAEREMSGKRETLFDLLGQHEPEADFDFDPPRVGEFSSHS